MYRPPSGDASPISSGACSSTARKKKDSRDHPPSARATRPSQDLSDDRLADRRPISCNHPQVVVGRSCLFLREGEMIPTNFREWISPFVTIRMLAFYAIGHTHSSSLWASEGGVSP
jgi:hypothetical protein